MDVVTIQTYFEILQDTLVGIEIPAFHASIRKRQRKNPKFYFFDTGVTRAMAGLLESPLHPKTSLYGKYFEQFIITEIHRLIKYHEKEWRLSYLASGDSAEIDLIIEKPSERIALEIKSSDKIDVKEVHAFERLAQDIPKVRMIYLSQDRMSQKHGSVECLHWKEAMDRIF